jgi:hypothetical protein
MHLGPWRVQMQTVLIPTDPNITTPSLATSTNPTLPQLLGLAKAELLKRLCSQLACDQDEGLVTLSIASFNLQAALAEATAQAAWGAAVAAKGGGVGGETDTFSRSSGTIQSVAQSRVAYL